MGFLKKKFNILNDLFKIKCPICNKKVKDFNTMSLDIVSGYYVCINCKIN
jgi:hypothetical protein